MKFNLQLREELKKYEKIVAIKSSEPVATVREENQQQTIREARIGPIEKVVGGNILWKPIDRTAAMLLTRAPWWCHPPQVQSKQIEEKPKTRKAKRMSEKVETRLGKPPPGVDPNATIIEDKSREQINYELAQEFVKRTSKTLDRTGEFVEKAMDARAALDILCERWKSSWLDFQDTTDSKLKDLRMTRMAVDSEMRQLMGSLREVREFFLDKDYDTEIARLKEFVDTCERLQKLKDCGFLDSVADTMLRLAERQ